MIDRVARHRDRLGFPIDGVVVKADADTDRARLGSGSRAPKWAVAYKYEAQSATTRVVDITTTVGKTGRLGIRIKVVPVFVGGTTVTYATGHNVAWMAEKDIRVGDTVTVKRANDVIPYIESVDLAARPADAVAWQPPATDPNGGEWDKSTLLWRSTDPSLSIGASIQYAASRDALDIDGMGAEIVDALVEQVLVTRLPDLFDLTVDDLANLPLASDRRLGAKNAVKLVEQIEHAKDAPWNRVITALGLRMTGRTMSRRLAAAFPNMGALLGASVTALSGVDGIGDVKAAVIFTELHALTSDADPDKGWEESTLTALAEAGVNMGQDGDDAPAAAGDLPLSGMTVVVSGAVPGYTRTTVAELIESKGGKASSSVSATTSLLVADPSTSSKYVKAQQLGVRIVTPSEFLEMLR
jgi:DNA ligase (NAD+)